MKCPHCGSQSLKIEVCFSGYVSCSFSSDHEFEVIDPVALNSEWGDDSHCRCNRCDWEGPVRDAQGDGAAQAPRSPRAAQSGGAMQMVTDIELEEIKHQLKVRYCNPIWRAHLENLVGEVERLRSILDLVERANAYEARKPQRLRDQASTDTSLM